MTGLDVSEEIAAPAAAVDQPEAAYPAIADVMTGPWPPLDPARPCGPDLDLDADADYLNFLAYTEGILPTTFFSLDDKRPFDRTSIDLPGRLTALTPLLARTRDLRLMVLQARLSLLNKDIAGFATALAGAGDWLQHYWDDLHPRPQGGDLTMREMALGELDGPMTTFPLQYAPLFETRRAGPISYRSWMIAIGDVAPRPGENKLATAAITEALNDADIDALTTARNAIRTLKAALHQIRNAFAMQGAPPGLDAISALTDKILLFVDPHGDQLAPEPTVDADSQAVDAPPALVGKPAQAASSATYPAPTSLALAQQALGEIANYYSRCEPSSPILPLIRQAHQLIGKSFYEVLTILVPTQMDKAAFQIGTEQVFELPLGKLSGLSAVPPIISVDPGATDAAAPGFQVTSRAQAIALLDQVQRFFRATEPSSPVPMLCERARAMADRDFMSVLRDVLPKAALKNILPDK